MVSSDGAPEQSWVFPFRLRFLWHYRLLASLPP